MLRAAPTWAVAAVAAAAWACGDGGVGTFPDAATGGDAASAVDAAAGPDGILSLLWVDFTATGCRDRGDDGSCLGAAPLTVRFSATAAAPITDYVWTFGDGGQSSEASPEHVYALPGSYDVSLVVGGTGGTARADRAAYVVVAPAAIGAPCDVEAQCAEGLTCICDDGSACPPGLTQGLCSRACAEGAGCPDDSVCADLAPAGWPSSAEWTQALCLATCESDGACADGLRCRELPGEGGGWVRGCFAPDVLGDVGESCRGGDGEVDDWLCAGGECLDLGVRGQCSARCDAGGDGCPSYAACVTFNDHDLGAQCVPRCAAVACTGDPWLACEGPGTGVLGFTMAGPADDEGYCAPRRCGSTLECGPDGDCIDGFCQPYGAD